MITREQYLEALVLIDEYHHQADLPNMPSKKTDINAWARSLPTKMSMRLHNLLIRNYYYENGPPFLYLEDVNARDFLKLRNAGKGSWDEFCELKILSEAQQI